MRRRWSARVMSVCVLFGLSVAVGAILTVQQAAPGREARPPDGGAPARTPDVRDIRGRFGIARNFRVVGHNPLLDDHQWADNEPLGIPRGSNADITVAGDCVYVGSLIGYQPAVIVDISNPRKPTVVGPVPDLVPGVGNGIEGIEASGDLLVIDQRPSLGSLGFEPPEGLPERGLAIYDVGDDCRRPELVARHDFGDERTHQVSVWRDPENSGRVLALEAFWPTNPHLRVIDLSGCPEDCEPREVAQWDLELQFGEPAEPAHTAKMSTDGRRIYMSQWEAGYFMLDSSRLVRTLRAGGELTDDPGPDDCNPVAPTSPAAEGHCITVLNPDIDARIDTSPPLPREQTGLIGEWYHTTLKVPGRPYVLQLQESTGPRYDTRTDEFQTANCPGAFTRIIYAGDREYTQHPTSGGQLLRGDLDPMVTGLFGLPEQQLENCGRDGWEPGSAALPAWFSPHEAIVFPNLAFITYYGAGFRAVDLSNPFVPLEVGYFFNRPVDEVRWASYGALGETERRDDGFAVRRPAPEPLHMFANSTPVTHDGHVVYVDTHSGLYVLEYRGPHAEQIPERGTCLPGNAGGVTPGFEPCAPYGRTDWGTAPERGESAMQPSGVDASHSGG
jgi:hypothetical protein